MGQTKDRENYTDINKHESNKRRRRQREREREREEGGGARERGVPAEPPVPLSSSNSLWTTSQMFCFYLLQQKFIAIGNLVRTCNMNNNQKHLFLSAHRTVL